ncbi:hypothetical protein VTK26DRAFT_1874 [Humicola hyalothermophila]
MAPDETKDRITCHVLDTTLGQPARGLRVKLELTSTSPATSTSSSSSSLSTGPNASAAAAAAAASAPLTTAVFESHTDEDGRIRTWLPYSSATSSGEVPVYTLEDVLGNLAASATQDQQQQQQQQQQQPGTAPPPGAVSQWTLRFDSAGYFGGADKTFYPEVAVTFTVREGERYHVPLLLAPYGYSTYRGS